MCSGLLILMALCRRRGELRTERPKTKSATVYIERLRLNPDKDFKGHSSYKTPEAKECQKA